MNLVYRGYPRFRKIARTLSPVILVGTGVTCLTYWNVTENSDLILSDNLFASYRIARLCHTVGEICIDYGFFKYVGQKKNTEFDQLMARLRHAQNDYEKYSIRINQSGPSEVELTELRNLAEISHNEMNSLGKQISTLSENEKSSALSEIHARCAIRLRDLCARNRGVYIKLGQHLAQLDYLLPPEYISTLRSLLSSSPQSSYESVRQVIFEDFGAYPEEIWTKFEEKPIASASLAQVHIAYDNKGNKYAIKVQHHGLKESSQGDMQAITFIVNLVARIFPEFTYTWLSREMNRNLPLELDFITEANNLKRCEQCLTDLIQSGDVVLPTVHRVSPRVLCMSFEEGTHVSEVSSIKAQHINPSDVSYLVSRIFCDQIFKHGFVHCDPHEANLLVRLRPGHPFLTSSPRPQIVLLDHGLYRELDDAFRRSYCRLWNGILNGDVEEIQKQCVAMGTGEDIGAYSLLSAALVMRPWEDIVEKKINNGVHQPTSVRDRMKTLKALVSDEQSEVIRAYAQRYFVKMISMLGALPSSLLLLLKTNDCLRHIDRSLGTPINTAAVVASTTANVIFYEDLLEAKSISKAISVIWKYSIAKGRAMVLRAYSQLWWMQEMIFSLLAIN